MAMAASPPAAAKLVVDCRLADSVAEMLGSEPAVPVSRRAGLETRSGLTSIVAALSTPLAILTSAKKLLASLVALSPLLVVCRSGELVMPKRLLVNWLSCAVTAGSVVSRSWRRAPSSPVVVSLVTSVPSSVSGDSVVVAVTVPAAV